MESAPASRRRRSTRILELALQLDRASGQPLTKQLIDSLRDAVLKGYLPTGNRLPATRVLAEQLGVSRMVTSAAYDQLLAEGYFEAKRGSGTWVRPIARTSSAGLSPPAPRFSATTENTSGTGATSGAFNTGMTTTRFIEADFGKALRSAARQPLPGSYLSPQGEPELRAALAAYLLRSRGLLTAPENIVLTSGSKQSTDLLLRVLARPGDQIGVEEPSYPWLRALISKHGMRHLGIPVDADGADVSELGSVAPRLIHITASHQFPLGVAMKVGRRAELVHWAQATGSYIVEDDYDSEFRFGKEPLPPLASLGSDRVLYLGTMSKILTPALRCGYIIAEASLAAEITELKSIVEGALPWPVQSTVLALLKSGDLERHIRRMRVHYGKVRSALRTGLQPLEKIASISGVDAGLHLVIQPLPGVVLDADRIAQRAAQSGLTLTALTEFYFSAAPQAGLLLGYGALEEKDVDEACELACNIILAEVGSGTGRGEPGTQ
ncbi:PLP-dependent aminotransferase family protein [Acaricomes phytoseiuli]|uniref:MocR-like pyridoxine biosynthesis transcription factor PdxR n=1 Tax=Acaricomes phytoseiuli TaxID=291968 RepID=UPI0003690E0C|nr:PLP-dependent aminotransferase family protein [Acaricomes phytoseiuli]MCW1248994.1 PLP-dependent aminotransferase family protein [Acaricomes phytoseiuli]